MPWSANHSSSGGQESASGMQQLRGVAALMLSCGEKRCCSSAVQGVKNVVHDMVQGRKESKAIVGVAF